MVRLGLLGVAAFVVLPALRRLSPVAAGLAGGSALDRGVLAAADTQARRDPLLLAPIALGAGALSFGVRVGAAVFQSRGLAGGVFGAVRSPPFLQARLTGRTALRRRALAAPGACAHGEAGRPLLARPLALVFGCSGRIPPRLSFRAQPCVTGAAGSVSLRRARPAYRALWRRRSLAAPGTQALGDARGAALAEALAVHAALFRRVGIGHDGFLHRYEIGNDGRPAGLPPHVVRRNAGRRDVQRSGRVSPSACGRCRGPSRSSPSTGPRRGT